MSSFFATNFMLLLLLRSSVNAAKLCDFEFCVSGSDYNATHVNVNITVPDTTGYVGFGVGKSMVSALDYIVFWRQDSTLVVSDRHRAGDGDNAYSQPIMDNVQNVVLLEPCTQTGSSWTICFVRARDTGDPEDSPFPKSGERTSYIWALNSAFAPQSLDPAANIKKHDRTGQFDVDLFQPLNPNVILPGQESTAGVWSNYCDKPFEFCISARTLNSTFAEIKLSGPPLVGWLAFGIGSNMPGADMWMAWLNDAGDVVLSDRHSTSFTIPEPDSQQDLILLSDSGTINGKLTIHFLRKFDTGDVNDRVLTFTPRDYIWAMATNPPKDRNNPNTMNMVEHDRQGKLADFALLLGSSTDPQGQRDPEIVDKSHAALIQSHGWIMFITFTILLPLTMWFMAYGRRVKRLKNQTTIHISLAVLSFTLTLIAIVLASAWVPSGQGLHRAHSGFGIAIAVFLFLQLCTGYLAWSKSIPSFKVGTSHKIKNPKTALHRGFGWIVFLLGIINAGMGVSAYGTIYGKSWILGYSLWVIVVILALIVSDVYLGQGILNRWKNGLPIIPTQDDAQLTSPEEEEDPAVVITMQNMDRLGVSGEPVVRRSAQEGNR